MKCFVYLSVASSEDMVISRNVDDLMILDYLTELFFRYPISNIFFFMRVSALFSQIHYSHAQEKYILKTCMIFDKIPANEKEYHVDANDI